MEPLEHGKSPHGDTEGVSDHSQAAHLHTHKQHTKFLSDKPYLKNPE